MMVYLNIPIGNKSPSEHNIHTYMHSRENGPISNMVPSDLGPHCLLDTFKLQQQTIK